MSKTIKRSLITALCVISVLPAVVCPCLANDRVAAKPYRIIFNCDGYGVFENAKGSIDAYIQNVFGPLEESQVDALFWNDGSGSNTASYGSDVLEWTGTRIGQVNPDLRRWIEEGNDPPLVVVREAKKRGMDVYHSFRINDIFMPQECPTFKVDYPEWILGGGKIPAEGAHAVTVSKLDEVYFPEFSTSPPVWNNNSFTVSPFDVADDLGGANARKVELLQLCAKLKNLIAGDVVDFQINGGPLQPMPVPDEGGVVRLPLKPNQLKVGRNEVGARLNQRGAEPEHDIILVAVEIQLAYE